MSKMSNNCGVYQIEHVVSGKKYVGSSVNIKKRWQVHILELNRGGHHNAHLQNAWGKYGADAFTFSLIEASVKDDLMAREQFWMHSLNAVGPQGFNISKLAGRPERRPGPHSEATKAKIRAKRALQTITLESTQKTRAANLGQKRTAEFCARLSVVRTGMKLSAEHVASIATAGTGTVASDATKAKMSASATGYTKSETHRANLSAALTGRKLSPETIAKRTASRRANGSY